MTNAVQSFPCISICMLFIFSIENGQIHIIHVESYGWPATIANTARRIFLAEVKVLKARQVAATSILASVFTCQNVFVLGLNMLSSV